VKKDILIIGDAHAKPGISNDRFYWLGQWAKEKKPHIIVDMGDWADMPSLSAYDYGKTSFEGRRYKKDIAAATDARESFNRGLEDDSKGTSSRIRTNSTAKKIALGGNHDEGRIRRVLEADSKLEGVIGINDFNYKEFGWDYVPYLEIANIQGFSFCHYFASGVMGRPIGGEMPSLQIIRKTLTSCVAGHSHLFDISHRTKPSGRRVWGICAGCFLASTQFEDYAKQANKMWWKGAILLRGCEGGDFQSLEIITVKELENMYGTKRLQEGGRHSSPTIAS